METMKPLPAAALILLFLLAAPAPAPGTDIDGMDGPFQQLLTDRHDQGDAPKCVAAYSSGRIGRFPSRYGDTCAEVGTRESEGGCPPVGSEPGATGHVINSVLYDAWWVWLGCDVVQPDYGIQGIDSDHLLWPHCVEEAFGMRFDQDECAYDSSDAGVTSFPDFKTCEEARIRFTMTAFDRPIYLNLLIDLNEDGDWNDNFACDRGDSVVCAYEWAVKNHRITSDEMTGNGGFCFSVVSPAFRIGPKPGQSWLRVSLSMNPVGDDFPWAGAGMQGGETEDYPVLIGGSTPVHKTTWGALKSRYESAP